MQWDSKHDHNFPTIRTRHTSQVLLGTVSQPVASGRVVDSDLRAHHLLDGAGPKG